jgi:hypothetical protein
MCKSVTFCLSSAKVKLQLMHQPPHVPALPAGAPSRARQLFHPDWNLTPLPPEPLSQPPTSFNASHAPSNPQPASPVQASRTPIPQPASPVQAPRTPIPQPASSVQTPRVPTPHPTRSYPIRSGTPRLDPSSYSSNAPPAPVNLPLSQHPGLSNPPRTNPPLAPPSQPPSAPTPPLQPPLQQPPSAASAQPPRVSIHMFHVAVEGESDSEHVSMTVEERDAMLRPWEIWTRVTICCRFFGRQPIPHYNLLGNLLSSFRAIRYKHNAQAGNTQRMI